jgi:hypothetical protein
VLRDHVTGVLDNYIHYLASIKWSLSSITRIVQKMHIGTAGKGCFR